MVEGKVHDTPGKTLVSSYTPKSPPFSRKAVKKWKEKRNYPAAPHLPCQRPDLDESGYFAGFILAAALLWIVCVYRDDSPLLAFTRL